MRSALIDNLQGFVVRNRLAHGELGEGVAEDPFGLVDHRTGVPDCRA